MTTVPLDTPDWLNPLPGGSHLLIDTGFNLLSLGGSYASPWVDVAAYSGLFVQTNGFDLVGDYGTWQVLFRDALGGEVIQPTYPGAWRGDLPLAVNVPVLGAQAQVQIIGAAHNVNSHLCVTGHGGGPGTAVSLASGVLAKISIGSLPAGVTTENTAPTITEGAAELYFSVNGQPGTAYVQVADSSGVVTSVGGVKLTAGATDTRRLWLPPQPIFLNVQNNGAAADAFSATLTRERS